MEGAWPNFHALSAQIINALLRRSSKGGALGGDAHLNFRNVNSCAPLTNEKMSAGRPLYCKLNNRGKRQFRKSYGKPRELSAKYAEYASVGLPAHKAALDGDVEALEEIFLWKGVNGVPALDVHNATPLHLAARKNRAGAIK